MQQDQLGRQELKAKKEKLDPLVLQAQQDLRDLQDLLEQKEVQELLVQLARLVLKVILVLRVLRDRQGPKDKKVKLEPQGQPELKVIQGQQDLPALPDLLAQQAQLEQKVRRVR